MFNALDRNVKMNSDFPYDSRLRASQDATDRTAPILNQEHLMVQPYKNAFHNSTKNGKGARTMQPGGRLGTSQSALNTKAHSQDTYASHTVLGRLKTRNQMFSSSYKTFENFGNKMPATIKRLQNDYILNHGGDPAEAPTNYQSNQTNRTSRNENRQTISRSMQRSQADWAYGSDYGLKTASKDFFTPAGKAHVDLNELGSTVNNKSVEELLRTSSIDELSQQPLVDLLTGSKKLKVTTNKSVLARKLEYIRNTDAISMQKMLRSYAGLDKKFITQSPWAQVGIRAQPSINPVET